MHERFDIARVAPGVHKAMRGLEEYLHQSGKEIADLAVAAINAWNRLAISSCTPAGQYQSRLQEERRSA